MASSPTSLPGTPSNPRHPTGPTGWLLPRLAAANLTRDLTQSRIDPPVTADRAQRRSTARRRRSPLALLLVPVVLVAAGVVLILVLGGGGKGGILGPITGGGEDDTVPPFDFRLSKTTVVATVEGADEEALRSGAATVADEITPVLDDLYTNAFLDPTNWREADYEEVFAHFDEEAALPAREAVETLTLGATAGDVYERVTPRRGSLRFSVLFDDEGAPDTVVVEVRFSALGERQDGTFTAIVSTGTWFLKDQGGWVVTAFDVSRADHETTPPPSPTPSGSASVATS